MGKLYGERIVLREYRREDLEDIRKWVNDPDVVDFLSDIFIYPNTINETEEYLNSVLSKTGIERGNFIIAHKDSEKYIGQIDLLKVDWRSRFAEIGIVIGIKENWSKGYGYEAIKLLQSFVFNTLNLNKLQLHVHDYNERARACYRKCGFVEEGIMRQHFYKNGKYTDYIIMSILKKEYDEM